MKILYGYPAIRQSHNRFGLTEIRIQHIERLLKAGFDVKPFCMSLDDRLPVLSFKQLDRKWKWKDKILMSMYDRFLNDIEECDVFYNSVGINFHPDFIANILQFTVFGCNDDPENSENLSKPVAASYDMCAIGNIAEIDTYKSWGVKNVVWQPMGFSPLMYNLNLTYDDILNGERDIDLTMIIDRLSRPRLKRMNEIDKAFPDGHFYGRGWKRGYLIQGKEVELLQQSKIGINIHNSTGPINTRLFYLPANGVLQICDNKSHLGKVFELNKEVIGFNDIKECIDLCHYYLSNNQARRIIAANGWKRAIEEYNEFAVFQRLIVNITKLRQNTINSKTINNINTKPKLIDKLTSPVYHNIEVFKKKLRIFAGNIYRQIK